MFYVERDENGKITALHQNAAAPGMEQKARIDREVLDFLYREDTSWPEKQILTLTDLGVVRILEDLIELLIEKQVFMLTELPESAQQKLRERRELRKKMENGPLMVDDII